MVPFSNVGPCTSLKLFSPGYHASILAGGGVHAVPTGDGVAVKVAVAVGVLVGVDVDVAVGVLVAVAVGVKVGVKVGVNVGVEVAVDVAVGVNVGVKVGVNVAVGVGVGVSTTPPGMNARPLVDPGLIMGPTTVLAPVEISTV